MNCSKSTKVLPILTLLFPFICAFSQDSDEDNSAEAAIVSSVSTPSAAAESATESNPIVTLVRAGIPFSQAVSIDRSTAKAIGATGIEGFLSVVSAIQSGEITASDVIAAVASGATLDAENIVSISKVASSISGDSAAVERLQQASTFVDTLLVDLALDQASISTPYNVGALAQSGQTIELLTLLNSYNAFGPQGDDLLSLVTADSATGLVSTTATSTADLIYNLTTFTGDRGFSTENINDSILDIDLSNITLNASSSLSVSEATTIDLDALGLLQAVDVGGDYDSSPSEENIHIFGASKDITISEKLTITNSNDAEDHALVLAAADTAMIKADITYSGSNLAIGSGDETAASMYLTGVTISAGGNLAVASLGTLNIQAGTQFAVGTANPETSDPDNVYLYANDLIDIAGLSFSGRLDDVYMEATRLDLNNVTFPATAEVMLRSQNGGLNFGTDNFGVGDVNFNNVKHLGIDNDNALTEEHFDMSRGAGRINSNAIFDNGSHMMRIRKQGPEATPSVN